MCGWGKARALGSGCWRTRGSDRGTVVYQGNFDGAATSSVRPLCAMIGKRTSVGFVPLKHRNSLSCILSYASVLNRSVSWGGSRATKHRLGRAKQHCWRQ